MFQNDYNDISGFDGLSGTHTFCTQFTRNQMTLCTVWFLPRLFVFNQKFYAPNKGHRILQKYNPKGNNTSKNNRLTKQSYIFYRKQNFCSYPIKQL